MKRAQVGRYSTREREAPEERVWAEVRLADGAAILVDSAAERIEPAEERRGRDEERPAGPVAQLRLRTIAALRAGAWAFLLVGALELALQGRDIVSYGLGTDLIMSVGSITASLALTILPAAILFRHPDAWRTQRPLILGATLWALPVAVDRVGWRVIGLAPMDLSELSNLYGHVSVLAALVSLPGGLLLLIGLDRARGACRTRWPRILVVLAVAATAALMLHAISGIGQWDPYTGWTPGRVRWWLEQLVMTGGGYLASLWLGGLAWSAISALRGAEQPRTQWLSLTIGFGLLFVFDAVFQDVLGVVGSGPWLTGEVVDALVACGAIGWVMVVAAFVVPAIAAPLHGRVAGQ